jgi:hypothetical protein
MVQTPSARHSEPGMRQTSMAQPLNSGTGVDGSGGNGLVVHCRGRFGTIGIGPHTAWA